VKKIKLLSLIICVIMLFAACATHTKPSDGYFLTKDLSNANVGIIDGCTEEAQVKDAIPGVKIKKFKNTNDAAEALQKDSVRALVLDSASKKEILNKNSNFKEMIQKVLDKKYYAAVYIPVEDRATKGDEFLLEVDSVMTILSHTDLGMELYNQYIAGDDIENALIEYNVDDSRGRVLKVGIIDDNAPFSYTNKNGDYVGFDVAVANEIAKSYHATLELQVMDRDALLTALENGVIDVAFGRLTDEDDASENDWLLFSMTYYDMSQSVILAEENVGINPMAQ